jgi:biopolymer transport protein ExbB
MNVLAEIVDYGIIGVLMLLSVWTVSIGFERWLFFRKVEVKQFQSAEALEMPLTHRLTVIGTVAANAPYIGLLGTVMGIMFTFHTLGTQSKMDVGQVMVGLSLALKATAVGLLVAIPCVALNNALRRRVRELMTRYEVQHGS